MVKYGSLGFGRFAKKIIGISSIVPLHSPVNVGFGVGIQYVVYTMVVFCDTVVPSFGVLVVGDGVLVVGDGVLVVGEGADVPSDSS